MPPHRNEQRKPARGSRLNWLLWWQVNQDELEQQVAGYGTIPVWRSARTQAVYCLAFSAVVTSLFIVFKIMDAYSAIDVTIFVVLGVFTFFAHRWAMVLAMIFWTFEKAFTIYGMIAIGNSGTGPATQLIWWAIYMHAFYVAFRVEQARRQVNGAVANPANLPD